MKTLIIGLNTVDYGSTGNIMRNSLEYASKNGEYDYLIITKYYEGKTNSISLNGELKKDFFHKVFRRLKKYFIKLLGLDKKSTGFFGYFKTKKINRIIDKKRKEYNNKIAIHIHNLHDMDLDLRILFKYLAKKHIKVFYTLHDEWAFTGGCCCYTHIDCEKWQIDCKNCPLAKEVEKPHFSASKMLKSKERYTLMLKDNLILIPVSKWLENEVKKSFLKDCKIIVNNGETPLVKSEEDNTYLREQLDIKEDEKVLISVSAYWNEWKGVKYLYQVADRIPKNYKLLVVGGAFDIKDYKNIIHVPNIAHEELAKYFSISDCFVSVTQADTLSLVCCESQICGVPIVGFGHGGTPDTITEKSGIMVGKENDVDKLVKTIIHVVEDKPFKKEDIIASGSRFKKYECAKRQLKIYDKYLRNKNGKNKN